MSIPQCSLEASDFHLLLTSFDGSAGFFTSTIFGILELKKNPSPAGNQNLFCSASLLDEFSVLNERFDNFE
jgi:hypothetical protein